MANTEVTTTSKQFTLNARDFLKGLLLAVISAVLTFITTSINSGSLHFDWKAIGTVAAITAISYLAKNFGTPSEVTIQNPKLAEEVKSGDAEVKVVQK